MATDLTFTDLLAEVRNGSQQAAWALIEAYGPHVRRVVRRSLNRELRSRFDSTDFVQIVWLSFFKERERSIQFDDPRQLIGFLAQVARNKVINEFRKQMQASKRNLNREVGQEDARPLRLDEVAGRQPTPSEFAIAGERWRLIFADQPEHYQEILRLRFMGETHESIAEKLNLTERTVRRVIKRVFQETFDGTGR